MDVPRTYSSNNKIRAELVWVNETPEPNEVGSPRQYLFDVFFGEKFLSYYTKLGITACALQGTRLR